MLNSYNSDILYDKKIRFLLLERGPYGQSLDIMKRYNSIIESAELLDTFSVGNQWLIDLYDITYKPKI